MERLTQSYLGIAALTALVVGLGMLLMPVAVYGGYGIDPTVSASLASELRSPGVLLIAIGAGASKQRHRQSRRIPALWAAAIFYLGYAMARALSLALDGAPSAGLLAAGALELALGLAAAFLLLTQRRNAPAA